MVIKIKHDKKNSEKRHDRETQRALTRMRTKSQEEFASHTAKKLGMPYIDLNITPISSDAIAMLPEETAKKYNVAVFHSTGKSVKLGTPTPENNDLHSFISKLKDEKGWTVELFVISQQSFEKLMRQYKNAYFIDAIDTVSFDGLWLLRLFFGFGAFMIFSTTLETESASRLNGTFLLVPLIVFSYCAA